MLSSMSKFQDKDLSSKPPPFLVHFIRGQRLIPGIKMRDTYPNKILIYLFSPQRPLTGNINII